jgi:hypothetical protein
MKCHYSQPSMLPSRTVVKDTNKKRHMSLFKPHSAPPHAGLPSPGKPRLKPTTQLTFRRRTPVCVTKAASQSTRHAKRSNQTLCIWCRKYCGSADPLGRGRKLPFAAGRSQSIGGVARRAGTKPRLDFPMGEGRYREPSTSASSVSRFNFRRHTVW